MTENRDFLAEFEQLRVETDGIRNVLVSKPVQYQNLVKEMMGELKEMRKEENDKKLEELKKEIAEQNLKMMGELNEMRKEMKEGKEELKLELNRKIAVQNVIMEQRTKKLKDEILPKMEEDRRENEKKLEELKMQNLKMEQKLSVLKNEILAKLEKDRRDADTTRKIPIRRAVLGEWKMVGHENWEDARSWGLSFEIFSENLKFELVDGKLKQSGAGHYELIEGEDEDGRKYLYVEDNHLKSIWRGRASEDMYIENGRLHFVQTVGGVIWKRIYEKAGASRMVPISEVEKLRVENKKLGEQMSALTTHFERFVADKEAKKLQQPQQSLLLSQKGIIFAIVFLFISGFICLMITRVVEITESHSHNKEA